ncbi:hypothetical protein TNCT_150641 [Trichonephila clavata]|uniref:PiggyBac transposable element-derived protein domain-containing protein n=1 Tax=Trichonephila clavata TaxID=2740835 RepID=A0A8X6J1T5_TRICU|nr:hypothetical protein TNCT_150641 [Trichonephila clavata]
MKSKVRTAFSLIIDHHAMNYIRIYTIEEVKRVPGTDLSLSQEKLDMTDQVASTTKSKTCRWPLQVFFSILDLAGINAWILCKQTTRENI